MMARGEPSAAADARPAEDAPTRGGARACEAGFCEVDGLRFRYLAWRPGAAPAGLSGVVPGAAISEGAAAPAAPESVAASYVAPIVLLHGFAQTAESWSGVAPLLATRAQRPVIAFDLLGHGLSAAPADDAPYGYDAQAAQVAALIAHAAGRFASDAPAVVGYSMGGRLALGAVLSHGAPCAALVLESPGLGPRDAAERERMRAVANGNARRLRELGIEGFFDWWERLPLFASQLDLSAEVRARIRTGRLAQDPVALERVLRLAGQDRMPDYRPLLAGAPLPVLYLAGSRDEKYASLARSLSWPDAPEPGKPFSHACRVVKGVGHDAHAEDPGRFASLVGEYLAHALKV